MTTASTAEAADHRRRGRPPRRILLGGADGRTSYDFAFLAFAQPGATSYQMFMDLSAILWLYGSTDSSSVSKLFLPTKSGAAAIDDTVTLSLNGRGSNDVVIKSPRADPGIEGAVCNCCPGASPAVDGSVSFFDRAAMADQPSRRPGYPERSAINLPRSGALEPRRLPKTLIRKLSEKEQALSGGGKPLFRGSSVLRSRCGRQRSSSLKPCRTECSGEELLRQPNTAVTRLHCHGRWSEFARNWPPTPQKKAARANQKQVFVLTNTWGDSTIVSGATTAMAVAGQKSSATHLDRRPAVKICMCRRREKAFTLVEVLIVVAVLAVLMALLLPALQSIRSAGRRTDCGNNLRQLATAVTSYHNRNGVMPPFWGAYPRFLRLRAGSHAGSPPVHTSWLGHILPDLDMQNEYLRLPKAKVCLGYRRVGHVPGQFGEDILDPAMALQKTEDDGVGFNVFQSVVTGVLEGNTINQSIVTGTISGSFQPTLVTEWKYNRVMEVAYSANGTQYSVWRMVPEKVGEYTLMIRIPDRLVYALVETKYGLGNVERNVPGDGYTTSYFNLSGTTPFGRGYPAAQETIHVPITVCKGDNSVIESSRKLPWLGAVTNSGAEARNWSTTNYLANPHAFAHVSAREALVRDPAVGVSADFGDAERKMQDDSAAPGPMGTGRYRVFSWSPRTFDHIKDGQANTILLSEAMRYCSTVSNVSGEAFPDVDPNQPNRYIEMARLAFWSSPNLSTPVDMSIGSPSSPAAFESAYTAIVHLAIQPHPKWAGTPHPGGNSSYMSMRVPEAVSWKPWTHNFGIEWERTYSPQSKLQEFVNTFMFQPQSKPEECSSIRAQANHGDTLMVAMCDGSVRPISSSISRRELSDAATEGKIVGREPNMGTGVDNSGKSTQADGAWDMLMKTNDGLTPPSQ